MDTLQEGSFFETKVYSIEKPEFLESVMGVSDRYVHDAHQYSGHGKMTTMTANFAQEPSIADFAQYVSQTAWNILDSQGYAMENLATFFLEMWTQEHNHQSQMDYHVHGRGAQISVFYFLRVPNDGCKILLHDPRPTKLMTNLFPANDAVVNGASTSIVISPNAGSMIFAPAWLPHSFTRNLSNESMHFVHMNLGVVHNPVDDSVEVI